MHRRWVHGFAALMVVFVACLAVTTIPSPSVESMAQSKPAAQVAILDSGYTRHYASLNAWDYPTTFVDTNALVATLARWNFNVAVIGDGDLEVGALASYRVLILPSSTCLSQLGAEKIQAFVEGGGRIFATRDTSLRDDFWRIRSDFGLSKVMGVHFSPTAAAASGALQPPGTKHSVFTGITTPVQLASTRGLTVTTNPNAVVVARWGSGAPAIVENRYGIYCSENVLCPANMAVPAVSSLVRNIVTYLVQTKYKADFNMGVLNTRAAWYVPATGADRIRTDLSRLAKANFNTVFVAAFRGGQALWPSSTVLVDPTYEGFDPLRTSIEIASSLGLDVHAWFSTFDAGYAKPDGSLPALLSLHPDWAAVGQNGKVPSASENLRCFLSPAHPGVQSYVLSAVTELCREYPLSGVHFDCLRYPYGRTVPYDYNPVVRELAWKDLGFDPEKIRLDMGKWNAWFDWRTAKLTSFANILTNTARETAPGIMVSAAVYPHSDAVLTRMQNWSKWAEDGLLDFIVQLTTTASKDLFDTIVRSSRGFAGPDVPVIAGIACELVPDAQLNTLVPTLAEMARAAGADGVALMADDHLTDQALSALAAGPFRK